MGWGYGGGLLGLANELVWLAVGVLLIMWLWGKIKQK